MRILSIIAAATLAAIAAPAMAQTAPGVPGEALPGQGAVVSATSTQTGKAIKLPLVLSICQSGGNYVVCAPSGGGGGDASAANQTNGTQIARAYGVTPGGTQTQIVTDSTGGLTPASYTPASTRYTLTASTITSVGAAAGTGQPGLLYKFVVEGAALTADVYICYAGQSTTCSATVHDDMIPSGSAVGTRLSYENPVKTAVYVFSTGTPVVNVTRSTVN